MILGEKRKSRLWNTIKILALDIDGVLTNGTAILTPNQNEIKQINFHDLDALTQARRDGLQIVLITGEDTAAVDRIASRFSISRVIRGSKDKVAALQSLSSELNIPLNEICYVGDSDRDAPALSLVGLGLAPANATPAAKAAADRVLSLSGGNGVVGEVIRLLSQLQVDERNAKELQQKMQRIVSDSLEVHQRLLDDSLAVLVQIAQIFIKAIRSGHKILLFGNGGSAADAQHVAGELVGRFLRESSPWPAIALTTDSSILTAVGNDWEFADVFARQVRGLARAGDVVVGISTSGKSLNVLRGLQDGRNREAITIGFTGTNGNAILEYTDVCFCAPAKLTPRIQELHLLAWHTICEIVETELLDAPA